MKLRKVTDARDVENIFLFYIIDVQLSERHVVSWNVLQLLVYSAPGLTFNHWPEHTFLSFL